VSETKEAVQSADDFTNSGELSVVHFIVFKAIVYALLTIAVAINQAAEKKGK
jgi:hypothetical protein